LKFEITKNNITEEHISLANKNRPKDLMEVEECMRALPIRAFPVDCWFETDFVTQRYFNFPEERKKWPSKSLKKYLKNYISIKAWIADFKFVREVPENSYQFIFAFNLNDELKVMKCNYLIGGDQSDGRTWLKNAIATGKQITVLVNPNKNDDVVILGMLSAYLITPKKNLWIAETDWSMIQDKPTD
jgi:hypothetical protein